MGWTKSGAFRREFQAKEFSEEDETNALKGTEALGCPPESVNVKAATGEGLGFVGRAEGIAALAVAVIIPLLGRGGR